MTRINILWYCYARAGGVSYEVRHLTGLKSFGEKVDDEEGELASQIPGSEAGILSDPWI